MTSSPVSINRELEPAKPRTGHTGTYPKKAKDVKEWLQFIALD